MKHYRLIQILICLTFIAAFFGCATEEKASELPTSQPVNGSIVGNISPINVYDAEVTVLRDEKTITIVGVEDGIFQIDDLPIGQYSLQISAVGYVTNDALQDIHVVAGAVTEVGRLVLFPHFNSKYIPTRITGTVRDAVSGAPVGDAHIHIECTEGICSTLEGISNAEGWFEIAIWANLASIVTVDKEGYQPARVEVVGIPTASSQSIEVKLRK